MADTALVVSICSAAFTGGSLISQFLLYRFNGARLKVQLVFCFRTDFGLTMSYTGPRRRISWQRWSEEHHMNLGIEYAKVRVTNIGRTSVSVEDISFDLGHARWFRRWRNTITPMPFVDPNDTSSKELDGSPQRLDPGDNVTASLHLWPALGNPDHFKHRKSRRLVVRGSARAVGRRPTRSSWRDAWRLRKGELSCFTDLGVPSPEQRLYRMLWQHSYGVERNPVWLHRELVDQLRAGKDYDEIREFIDQSNIDPKTGKPVRFQANHMVAYDAHHAYHKTSGNSLWPEVDPPQQMSRRDRVRRVLFGQSPRKTRTSASATD